MLKITGAILLTAGTTGIGVSLLWEAKRRLYHVRYIHRIFTLLAGEISYAKATIGEACKTVSTKAESPYGDFLRQVYTQIAENAGASFAQIWKEAVKKHLSELPFKETELHVIEAFADYTGYMDIELQKCFMTYEIQDLEKLAGQIEEELSRQGKLYVTFGVMSGLFLTIILL